MPYIYGNKKKRFLCWKYMISPEPLIFLEFFSYFVNDCRMHLYWFSEHKFRYCIIHLFVFPIILFCIKCKYYDINKRLINACWHSQHKCDYIIHIVLPVERVYQRTPTQYTMKVSGEPFLHFYYASIVVSLKCVGTIGNILSCWPW